MVNSGAHSSSHLLTHLPTIQPTPLLLLATPLLLLATPLLVVPHHHSLAGVMQHQRTLQGASQVDQVLLSMVLLPLLEVLHHITGDKHHKHTQWGVSQEDRVPIRQTMEPRLQVTGPHTRVMDRQDPGLRAMVQGGVVMEQRHRVGSVVPYHKTRN